MTTVKRLSIILPSYNDHRIERAIRSIRRFDDVETVRIVVVDGGSSDQIREIITDNLGPADTCISEPDKGIFDALNKGLEVCNTDFIGFLGSDDLYTGNVLASQVLAALADSDLFVANLAFFQEGYITRKMWAFPSRIGLTSLGLHNPHHSTFGAAALLKSERFRLGLRGSDIEYFIKIFRKKPRVTAANVVATLQEEGGFSNSSLADVVRTNMELVSVYAQYTNWILGAIAVLVKLSSKLASRVHYRLFRERVCA